MLLNLFAQVGDRALRRDPQELGEGEAGHRLDGGRQRRRAGEPAQEVEPPIAHHLVDEVLGGRRQDEARRPADQEEAETERQPPAPCPDEIPRLAPARRHLRPLPGEEAGRRLAVRLGTLCLLAQNAFPQCAAATSREAAKFLGYDVFVPELPDLTIYLEALEERVVGTRLEGVRLKSPFLVRTVEPKMSEFVGRELVRCGASASVWCSVSTRTFT